MLVVVWSRSAHSDRSASYRAGMAHRYGNGSVRLRRPGVWEIRVSVGTDPLAGRTVQRSVTFRGTESEARQHCTELAAAARARR